MGVNNHAALIGYRTIDDLRLQLINQIGTQAFMDKKNEYPIKPLLPIEPSHLGYDKMYYFIFVEFPVLILLCSGKNLAQYLKIAQKGILLTNRPYPAPLLTLLLHASHTYGTLCRHPGHASVE